jgi:hypothetical protein
MSNRSKTLRSCFAVVSLLLFATAPSVDLALAFPEGRESYNPPPFASYPQTAAFRYVISTHVDPTRVNHQEAQLLFNATWFIEGSARAAEQLQIFKDGYVYSIRSVYDWAEQAPHTSQLTSSEQGRVFDLIETIEKVDGRPPLVDLLIVSFSRNGKWMTVLLDRNRLPGSIGKIYELTKSRSPVRGRDTRSAAP